LHNKNETPTMWLISKLRNYATRSWYILFIFFTL
jgi:hypothetical protein